MEVNRWWRIGLLALFAQLGGTAAGAPALPRVASDRYQLELVASEPEIVTPIGMAFDRAGRLLVVESHTHKRPRDYVGPARDRIRMLADSDGDGKLDRWTTFAEGFLHAMNLLVAADGSVYVLARHEVVRLRDTDGDGRADEREQLLRLESDDDYPHNGLGGIAQRADGSLLLCLGENHGFAFKLFGSDGSMLTGGGGLDGVIEATAAGGQLRWLAHGVWNPFSICLDTHGQMFAVDNDPDASPPCRLLHIVPGGDYGFRFQYGRAGTHPLQAWNGELPGTLPMVAGVGEAPTAIAAHAGSLWVTSWGDHRVERYRLSPRGASFDAEREIVVQGNADFRPTGLAVAPDGSLYFGDWRRRDYEVHHTGRIWRLVLPKDELQAAFPRLAADHTLHVKAANDPLQDELRAADSADPFLRQQVVWQLVNHNPADPVIAITPGLRLAVLQAWRWRSIDDPIPPLRAALADESPEVRLYAVRWIADERIVALRDEVARLLDGPLPTPQYYLAVLAAVDWLDHPFDPATTTGVGDALLVRELDNAARPTSVKSLALKLLPPNEPSLTLERLGKWLVGDDRRLRLEAVRTLALQSNPERFAVLAATAADPQQDEEVRAEAVAGLAGAASAHRPLVEKLATSDHHIIAREAARVLRLAGCQPLASEPKPPATDLPAWAALVGEGGDADSGRRLFFSAVGARCAVCHKFDGRGGAIGPDLTNIGRTASRDRVLASILQPSREIAPHYQPWVLTTRDGKVHTGLRLAKAGDDGIEPYADASGARFTLPSESIESRQASAVSIMPAGLEQTISIDDLRDLVAFLMHGSSDSDSN